MIYTSLFDKPFSFFNYIIINPQLFSNEELEAIIMHEKVHCKQRHSIDVVISQLYLVAFWWSPLFWNYQKLMVQNLEFLADNRAVFCLNNKTYYQKTLVKSAVTPVLFGVVNPFNQSFIKRRIMMLNKTQSDPRKCWKMTAILPIICAFVYLFQIETVAQVKETVVETATEVKVSRMALEINKNTKDTNDFEFVKKSFDVSIKITDVKRNEKDEITALKIEATSNDGKKSTYQVDSNAPIIPFLLVIENENNDTHISFENVKSDHQKHIKRHLGEVEKAKATIVKDSTNATINNDFWTINSYKEHGKDMAVVINGKLQSNKNPLKIAIDEDIQTVNVITDEDILRKYNLPKGTKAVIINTKKTNAPKKKYKVVSRFIINEEPPTPPDLPENPITDLDAPTPPDFPDFPDFPSNNASKSTLKKYEKAIKEYELKMNSINPKMKRFETEMALYEKKLEKLQPQIEIYEKQMIQFEKAMKKFNKEMEKWQQQQNK